MMAADPAAILEAETDCGRDRRRNKPAFYHSRHQR
jgi:hypothetical protein